MSNDTAIESVLRFNRRCRWAALLAIFALTGLGLFARMKPYDFPQYQMGALVAREGAWPALYPIPRPASVHNPGSPDDSELQAEMLAILTKYHAADGDRFIHPPPMALFLLPLAYLSASEAHLCWVGLMILSAWGVAVNAGRIYSAIEGRAARASGIITLGAACSPVLLFAVRIANVLPLTAYLLSLVILDLINDSPRPQLNRRRFFGGIALFGAVLTKYVGVVLLPLHVLLGRWRTIAWFVVITTVTIFGSLAIMGTAPFREYATVIVPTLGRPISQNGNQSIQGLILRMTRRETLPGHMPAVLQSMQLIVGCFVLYLLLAARRNLRKPEVSCAASSLLIVWLLAFAPINWYQLYLVSLWGWLVWELRVGRWLAKSLAIVALGLGCASASMQPLMRLPEPLASYQLISLLAMAGLAALRMRAAANDARVYNSGVFKTAPVSALVTIDA